MTDSDALATARWLHPTFDYQQRHGRILCSGTRLPEWDPDDYRTIADAESVLIERGLAEEYGWALSRVVHNRGEHDSIEPNGTERAQLATAPLDARVRAMAAVIRGLKP